MSDPNTIRILSLDGGGMRGIFQAKFMEQFVQLWGINPNEIWKYFDVISGTSAGGLQALGYAIGLSPTDMMNFFVEDGPWIFSTSAVVPSVRATMLDKFATIILGGSFYPNTAFTDRLNDVFADQTMADMKTNTLITSYNYDTNTPVLYSNIIFPDSTGQNEFAKNVGLATASAPFYFPKANWGTSNFIDGGLIKNNPSMLAYALGQVVKKVANRVCILSVGSGLGDIGFHDPSLPPPDELNAKYVFSLVGIAIAGGQETDAKELNLIDLYSLNNVYTYRAQTVLDVDEDTDIDNTSPEFIDYMTTTAIDYFQDNITAISNFLGHLTI